MRNKIIDFFLGEPEEISVSGELAFYGLIAFFIFAAVAPWIITM